MKKPLKIAGALVLVLAAAFLVLTLIARGDGLPPRAIAADGARLAASPAGRFVLHEGEAREMAFLTDGRLAAAGTDGRIVLLDLRGRATGTIVHQGGLSALALSPDGATLASGGYDRTARLWRVADGRPIRVLQGHGGTVWTLAWSPDGQWLATAGEDKLIRIWRANDGTPARTLAGHALNIWSVRFSPDSRLLASGSFDHSIRLWDVAAAAWSGGSRGTTRPWSASPSRPTARCWRAAATTARSGSGAWRTAPWCGR